MANENFLFSLESSKNFSFGKNNANLKTFFKNCETHGVARLHEFYKFINKNFIRINQN